MDIKIDDSKPKAPTIQIGDLFRHIDGKFYILVKPRRDAYMVVELGNLGSWRQEQSFEQIVTQLKDDITAGKLTHYSKDQWGLTLRKLGQ